MGPDTNPRSIGPDKKPLSIGPDPIREAPEPDWNELRGTGWRGREAKESELSKVEARSMEEVLYGHDSTRAIDRVWVDTLALTEAPEIEWKNGVVCRTLFVENSEWTLEE